MVIGLEGDEEGYVDYRMTHWSELGLRDDEIATPVIWPHMIDEVRNRLVILFSGAIAVSKVTGVPYREVEGGGGDNDLALDLIKEVEALRRRPGFEFITDTYRPFLYPGSLFESARLIGREDLLRAILAVGQTLAVERTMTGGDFRTQMAKSGVPRGRRWFEKGRHSGAPLRGLQLGGGAG